METSSALRMGLSGRVVAGVAAMGLSLALTASARPAAPKAAEEALAAPAAVEATLARCDNPPDTAEGWQDMMASVEAGGWHSGDGITSVKLPLGQLIISSGDNISFNSESKPQFRRNALLSICGEKARNIVWDGEAIPSVGEEWYWPGEMVVNEEQGKLYVFASRMAEVRKVNQNNGLDLGSFTGSGVDLAVFSIPKTIDEDPEFLYMAKTPASNSPEFDADGIRRNKQWGMSVVDGQDGFLYVYGSHLEAQPYNLGRDAYVARVPADELENPAAWQYFSGKKGWTNNEAAAISVIDSAKQPGLDVSWTTSYEDGVFRIVSKRDGSFGDEIGEWTAATPMGPFSYRKLADTAPFNQNQATYNAHHHPSVVLRDGSMLVSLCQNTNGNLKYVVEHPEQHRPVWYSFTAS